MDKYDGRVVTNFIRQMLNKEDITVYGNGNQTRCFCYVDDTVNGLFKLMNSNYNLPVNIGNENEISISSLIHILISMIKSKSRITYHPLPSDDPTNRKPDISLAKKILDWEPKINSRWINQTINFIKITKYLGLI